MSKVLRQSVLRTLGAAITAALIVCVWLSRAEGAPQAAGRSARQGAPSPAAGRSAPPKPAPAGTQAISAPPLPGVRPQVITHLAVSRKVIALTFDACQTEQPARYDAAIIRILQTTHTPATLLLGGRWMETHPEETRALARDPLFELGNHSYIHPHMTRVSAQRAAAEMQKPQDILYRLTGKQGTLFRPPYGEYNEALVKSAALLGLRTLKWSIVTGDPDPHVSAKAITQTVLAQARPGAIIIMHVNGRGWHSAEALPTLIQTLRARGYTFVKVSDALP